MISPKISLVQMEINHGNIEANLTKIKSFIKTAKKKGTDIIVFPEDSLTGIVRGKPELVDHNGKYRSLFSILAKENKIDIVCSFIESEKGKWYNACCYFDQKGNLLGHYRKINLWHSEREYLAPGKELAVFNTRFGKVGLAICWDLSNPLLFRKMAKLGAKIIYVPSFWSDAGISSNKTESKNIDNLCHVRAFENECAIVYVNAAGTYLPNDHLTGHTQITIPIKGAIKKLAHNKEGMMLCVLPAAIIERAAKVYKIRRDILADET